MHEGPWGLCLGGRSGDREKGDVLTALDKLCSPPLGVELPLTSRLKSAVGLHAPFLQNTSPTICVSRKGALFFFTFQPVFHSSLLLNCKHTKECLWFLKNKTEPSTSSSCSLPPLCKNAFKTSSWNGPANFKMVFFSANFGITQTVTSLCKGGNSFFKHLMEK